MKKEIESKKGAKEKIKKHLNGLAIKKSPYVTESANKKIQKSQKPRG